MTKKELVARLHENLTEVMDVSKTAAETIYDVFCSVIADELSNGSGEVTLQNVGVFRVKQRNARKGVNPKTGEKITIAARKALTFKPGKAMKDSLN